MKKKTDNLNDSRCANDKKKFPASCVHHVHDFINLSYLYNSQCC